MRMAKPATEPAKVDNFDVEAFSRNLGRADRGRRQGTRRLYEAARGRQGQERPGRGSRRRRQDARPGRGILAGRPGARRRTANKLGRAYLELWGNAVKRLAGEAPRRSPHPTPNDKRFADPEWSQNQFFDFLKQAYLLTATGPTSGQGRRRARPAYAAEGRVLRPPDRQRDVAVEFRADQSGIAARDARLERARIWCAACTCWPKTSRPGDGDLQNPPVRSIDVRGRPQPRADARQGRLPERPDAAHPVRGDDRRTCSRRRC